MAYIKNGVTLLGWSCLDISLFRRNGSYTLDTISDREKILYPIDIKNTVIDNYQIIVHTDQENTKFDLRVASIDNQLSFIKVDFYEKERFDEKVVSSKTGIGTSLSITFNNDSNHDNHMLSVRCIPLFSKQFLEYLYRRLLPTKI